MKSRLKEIEDSIADSKTYMGELYWLETGINGEDIEWLIARVHKLTEALEYIVNNTNALSEELMNNLSSTTLNENRSIARKALDEE